MTCTTIEYQQTGHDSNITFVFRNANARHWAAGEFDVGGTGITVCKVAMTFHTRVGTPSPDSFHAEIWSDNGGSPNAPSAQVGIDSNAATFSDIATDATDTEIEFTWDTDTGPALSANTTYWVVIVPDWSLSNSYSCSWAYNSAGSYRLATYEVGVGWTPSGDADDAPTMKVYLYEEAGGSIIPLAMNSYRQRRT